MSSSLLGKRAREESDEEPDYGIDRLFDGRGIVEALERFLQEPGEKGKGDFDRFLARFKESEYTLSRNLNIEDVKNVIYDFKIGYYLPFDRETSEMLTRIIHDKTIMSENEYVSFIESSLAKFLAPNLLVQWIEIADDAGFDFRNINPAKIRFVSNLFLALCSDPSNPIEYYLSNLEKKEKIEDYLFRLRISNVFEFVYLYMRLGECQSIEKNFFGNNYGQILLQSLNDFINKGVIGYSNQSTNLVLNNFFNTFYGPFFRNFIEDKNWDECMSFFLANDQLKARRLNFTFLVYEDLFLTILNTPEMRRRIQTGHEAGSLTRGYYKVLEQIYEFCPYFIIYLLKTNLCDLYDQKIINHLVQKYINLITLILLGGRNSSEFYFPQVYLDDIISAIQNYSRKTGTVFHINYITCPSFNQEKLSVTMLYKWFKAIPVSGEIMKKYRVKCPQIFGSRKWYEKESMEEERVLEPPPPPPQLRVRRPSVEFPRTNTLDRVFYFCFF